MLQEILIEMRGKRTKAEFARLVGVSGQAIDNYEKGRTPKKEILDKIAARMGKRIKWIIEDVEGDK